MKKLLFILFILLLPLGVIAQTVTVDAGNPSPNNVSTFNSIQMAINSFQASGDTKASSPGGVGVNHGNAAPDIINIITTTVVDEAIFADAIATVGSGQVVLDESLTIQGSGVDAIVALKMTGYGAIANDCGLFFRQDVNLNLNHIIFIPSRTSTPTDDALYFRHTVNPSANPVIMVDHVVVTANNGSDAPITTTGLTVPDFTGATGFGDDAVYVVSTTEGGNITMNATYFIVSSFNTTFTMDPARTGEGANDGIIIFMTGATNDIINAFLNLGDGCVISNTPRMGIQNPYGGKVTINGTHDNPVILYNTHSDGIWNSSDATSVTQATQCIVNNCIINNTDAGGVKEQETGGRGFVKSVTNTIIANCSAAGIELYAFGALPPGETDGNVTISNVTIHNCGFGVIDPGTSYDFRAAGIAAPTYLTTNKSNRNVNISDVIITGCNTGLYNSGTGVFNIDYSALVTESLPGYEYPLTNVTGGPSTIIVGANVINNNPEYLAFAESQFASSAYMDVTNTVFEGKGSGGTDLAGGADYAPPTAVHYSWSLYE